MEQVSGQSWGQTALTITLKVYPERSEGSLVRPAAHMVLRAAGRAEDPSSLRSSGLGAFQHHGHADPARRADGDQAVMLPGALQLVADGGDDARAGGAERMA